MVRSDQKERKWNKKWKTQAMNKNRYNNTTTSSWNSTVSVYLFSASAYVVLTNITFDFPFPKQKWLKRSPAVRYVNSFIYFTFLFLVPYLLQTMRVTCFMSRQHKPEYVRVCGVCVCVCVVCMIWKNIKQSAPCECALKCTEWARRTHFSFDIEFTPYSSSVHPSVSLFPAHFFPSLLDQMSNWRAMWPANTKMIASEWKRVRS